MPKRPREKMVDLEAPKIFDNSGLIGIQYKVETPVIDEDATECVHDSKEIEVLEPLPKKRKTNSAYNKEYHEKNKDRINARRRQLRLEKKAEAIERGELVSRRKPGRPRLNRTPEKQEEEMESVL